MLVEERGIAMSVSVCLSVTRRTSHQLLVNVAYDRGVMIRYILVFCG